MNKPLSVPLAQSEAELLALEQRRDQIVLGAKRVRYHLRHCENGLPDEWGAFHELLKFAGIFDEVLAADTEITQPAAEMGCYEGE